MTELHEFHPGGRYRFSSEGGDLRVSKADGGSMAEQPDAAALESGSARIINVLVVIDTEAFKKQFPSKQANPNPTNPERLVWKDMSNHVFLMITGSDDVQQQGTAKAVFSASAGDVVSFAGTSIYGNADDAVILYGIEYASGTSYHIFNQFVTNTVVLTGAAMPNPGTLPGTDPINGMPAIQGPVNFSSVSATARQEGSEYYYVDFGLYTKTKGKQELYGYYAWTWEAMIKIV